MIEFVLTRPNSRKRRSPLRQVLLMGFVGVIFVITAAGMGEAAGLIRP